MTVGTADKGERSMAAEKVRRAEALSVAAMPGGEDDMICVDEVGTGVG